MSSDFLLLLDWRCLLDSWECDSFCSSSYNWKSIERLTSWKASLFADSLIFFKSRDWCLSRKEDLGFLRGATNIAPRAAVFNFFMLWLRGGALCWRLRLYWLWFYERFSSGFVYDLWCYPTSLARFCVCCLLIGGKNYLFSQSYYSLKYSKV